MEQSECTFCALQYQSDNPDIVFEDDRIIVVLDPDWVVKGHTLVIWKKHYETASELPQDDFRYFADMLYRTEKAVMRIAGGKKAVILESGILIPHFHMHVYPIQDSLMGVDMSQYLIGLINKAFKYEPKVGERDLLVYQLRSALSPKPYGSN